MHTNSLLEYRNSIEYLSKIKDTLIFPNKDAKHASIVLEVLIRDSVSEILFYDSKISGDLSNPTQNNIIKELKNKIDSGARALFVLKNRSNSNSEIATFLKTYTIKYPDRLDVRLASPNFINKVIEYIGSEVFFTISDRRAFRLELSEGTDERRAICSFNSPQNAKKYSIPFQEEFENCEKYF